MVEYRKNRAAITDGKLKSRAGMTAALVAVFLALLFGLLFASGFWNARPDHADTVSPVQVESPGNPA